MRGVFSCKFIEVKVLMQSAVRIMDVFHFYHTDPHQVSFPENAIAKEDTQSHRDRNHVRSIG